MSPEINKINFSRRHHFLPVFYLKGFSNTDGLIFVYDKIKDTILPNQKPESKFYEKDLNNYKIDGDIKFTLEEPLFTAMDTRVSPIFNKIRRSQINNVEELNELERLEILHFLVHLFWRSPETNDLFVELMKKEGLSNNFFGFVKKGGGEFVSDEEIETIRNQLLNDEEIQKIFKHTIPVSAGVKETVHLFDKWKLFTLNTEALSIITGDNPFLINNDDIKLDNVFNELIFPISNKKLLILSSRPPSFLDSYLVSHANLAILHQSKRFISSESEEQLNQLIVDYKEFIKLNLDKALVKNTFGLMYHQSKFKDFNEYLNDYRFNKEVYQNRDNIFRE